MACRSGPRLPCATVPRLDRAGDHVVESPLPRERQGSGRSASGRATDAFLAKRKSRPRTPPLSRIEVTQCPVSRDTLQVSMLGQTSPRQPRRPRKFLTPCAGNSTQGRNLRGRKNQTDVEKVAS